MSAEHDVVGIGNAIVDVLAEADHDFVDSNGMVRGAMTLIDADRAEALYGRMGPAVEVSGGSAANTVAGIAALGGNAGYIGKVCDDQLGAIFRHDIAAAGVTFATRPVAGRPPTARCLILVTPDGQRTMNTYLGACVELGPEDIDETLIENTRLTYLEGYLWDRPRAKDAFLKAAELAHGADRQVALSLSDRFCVERHRDSFLDLVAGHVDILFGNAEELQELYRTSDLDAAIDGLRGHCRIAAVTRGAEGSLVLSDGVVEAVPAHPVERVVDTTGAGDLYAAGFLFGLTQGRSPAACGRMGSIAAAEVIGHFGARPQSDLVAMFDPQP